MIECFVIQPFDDGKFDKRYIDIFVPAITSAGLEPYRVDKDISANDLVAAIKDGIDRSAVILADITTDNPNVWYELGHAIAKSKPYCLICSDERIGAYPFDIGHLKVLPYKTGSMSDFHELTAAITARLKALNTKEEQLKVLSTTISSSIPSRNGLDPFEQFAILLIFEEHLEDGISIWTLRQSMEKSGFTKAAVSLAVLNLMKKGLVEQQSRQDRNDETYLILAMTSLGIEWIQSHPQDIVLHVSAKSDNSGGYHISDDDIPF